MRTITTTTDIYELGDIFGMASAEQNAAILANIRYSDIERIRRSDMFWRDKLLAQTDVTLAGRNIDWF